MKTATIERYHVWGTPRHNIRVTYRGKTLNHWEGLTHSYADMPDSPEAREHCKAYALRQGFDMVRYVGDWSKTTKPKGGKLRNS